VRITAIRRSRRARHLLDVELDGERRLTLPDEAVVREGLNVGNELSAAEIEILETEEARCLARETALRMLSSRGRTRADLARRLERRGHDREIVASVVQQLAEAGLLDDDAVAREYVRARITHRPLGPGRLAAGLRAKGLDDAAARSTIDRVLREEGVTELEAAARVAEGWLARTPGARSILADLSDAKGARRARQRLLRHLLGRGFSRSVAGQVARSAGGSDPGAAGP